MQENLKSSVVLKNLVFSGNIIFDLRIAKVIYFPTLEGITYFNTYKNVAVANLINTIYFRGKKNITRFKIHYTETYV